MTWNHRVLASKNDNEVLFEIHEVYYDQDDNPNGYTENPVPISGSNLEEIKWVLERMNECLDKDVLWKGDKFPMIYSD